MAAQLRWYAFDSAEQEISIAQSGAPKNLTVYKYVHTYVCVCVYSHYNFHLILGLKGERERERVLLKREEILKGQKNVKPNMQVYEIMHNTNTVLNNK